MQNSSSHNKYSFSLSIHIMSGIFLVAAKRTPFGSFGGSLKALSATQLGVASTQAALESANLDPEAVDSIFFGNVVQSSPDAAYLSRHVGLKSGLKQSTPSLTINRLCGSGFETVILGAQSIKLGESQISVCGGSENMSDAPLTLRGNDARWGVKLGTGLKMGDSLWDGLTDSHAGTPMGVTAENLAKKYGITREVSMKNPAVKKSMPSGYFLNNFHRLILLRMLRNAMHLHFEVNRNGVRRRKRVYLTQKWLRSKSRLAKDQSW